MGVKRRGEYRHKRGEFFQLSHEIVDRWAAIIGPSALAVYLLLARRYNPTTGQTVYQSRRTMSVQLGIARNTLNAAIMKLEQYKLIERQPLRRRVGREDAHVFYPVLPVPGGTATIPPVVQVGGSTENQQDVQLQQVPNHRKHTGENIRNGDDSTAVGGVDAALERQRKRNDRQG